MAKLLGQTISQFKVIEVVGEGGMGVVYRARDLTLDRDIALKFLPGHLVDSEESTRRFHNEAKSISVLDHPNICTIHGFGEHQGLPYIAMSLVDGLTLEERLAEASLSTEQAIEVTRQIAKGLSAAHGKGIIHRDLKPANIMIDSHSVVKIMDFGLARREGGEELTQSGSTLGTLSYMSPEQVRGEAVDARTDLWALGVILFEMLLGKRPFAAKYDAAVMHLILNEDPEGLEAIRPISAPLFSLVEELLEKDSKNRPASAEAIIEGLNKISNQHVSLTVKGRPSAVAATPSEGKTSRFFRIMRRRRFLPIVGSYLAVAIGLMEVVPYLIDQYQMDPGWHQILLIWVLTGFPLAGLIAYFHGRKGRDRITGIELVWFAAVLLIASGLSLFSWRGSRDAGPAAASVVQSARAGVDFAELRTQMTAIRSEMLNEKLAAEKAKAGDRAKAMFDHALVQEQIGDEKYTEGTVASLSEALQAYQNARDAYKKAGSEAQIVAQNQQAARVERNSIQAAESARSRMLSGKMSVNGDAPVKAAISEYTQAQRRESEARAQFDNGNYIRAKTLFDQAERLYRDASAKVTAKELADSAKERMLLARQGIGTGNRSGAEYEAGLTAQVEGETAYTAGKYAEAGKQFQIAHRLFTASATQQASAAPAKTAVDQRLATTAINRLIKQHETYVAAGNLQGLRQLGVATDMWEQSRFFDSTEDRQVRSNPKITLQGANRATVALAVSINFKIKGQSQDPLRFNRLWQLEATNGRWVIVSDTKAN